MYTIGQLEPTKDVLNPVSKEYRAFHRNRFKAIVLKALDFAPSLSYIDVSRMFRDEVGGEGELKKALKEVELDID